MFPAVPSNSHYNRQHHQHQHNYLHTQIRLVVSDNENPKQGLGCRELEGDQERRLKIKIWRRIVTSARIERCLRIEIWMLRISLLVDFPFSFGKCPTQVPKPPGRETWLEVLRGDKVVGGWKSRLSDWSECILPLPALIQSSVSMTLSLDYFQCCQTICRKYLPHNSNVTMDNFFSQSNNTCPLVQPTQPVPSEEEKSIGPPMIPSLSRPSAPSCRSLSARI